MCRPYCTTPDFLSLPEIPGVPGHRVVHGIWMTEEEYRVTGWHSRGDHPTPLGTTEHAWTAPIEGHIEWSRVARQSRESGITERAQRRAADDEWSDNVVSMIEGRQR
jgi:hypothetical protein